MIPAHAIVDELGNRAYSVEVWNDDARRVYTITANSDNEAAMEGIARFVEEMEALADATANDNEPETPLGEA